MEMTREEVLMEDQLSRNEANVDEHGCGLWYTWGIADTGVVALQHVTGTDWTGWRMNHFITRRYDVENDETYIVRDYG